MALSFGLKTAADWLHKTVARFQFASGNISGTENPPETQSSIAGAETVVTENEFQTLTPIVDPDKEGYQPYFKALDYALSRDDVKNIAITGPYGAGKSSVILSYLKKIEGRKRLWHRLKYWLRFTSLKPADEHVTISLANFETDETLKSSESLSKEQSIEYSILQQILYKVDKGTLPDSRVERIHTRSVGQILTTSCLLFFVLALAIVVTTLLFPQKIVSTFSLSSEVSHFIAIHPVWRWGCIGSLSFIICWYLLSRFYRIGFFDRKIALDKVNLLKAEIAAEKQNTASLLNLYIDEIVYFFLKTKYKVVVFEDLDRLNNGHIFIKLREINQVVNNSSLLEKKPIKFIFAVREDLLKDAESQTKFFDFIVPVIPAVDSENAYDILSGKVINFNAADKEQFFKKVSLYLTDMRVMNNVINEFNIFKKLITGEISDVKLFSLIMYKNLCTKDFTLLDNQDGFLYRVVNAYSKRTLHDVYFKDLEISISQQKEKLEKAQEELQTSSLNLRAEILRRYLPEQIEANTVFYISHNKHGQIGSSWSFVELCENESLFCDFLNRELPSGTAISHERNGYHYHDAFPISRDKRSESLREYNKRSPIILDKNQKTIEQLSKSILNTQRVLSQRK
ncbi:P-loop NTPase fold protein, partial [Pectobacterium brasiliense]|uniref:YobI family P-loop NTPase n=1 Tax=Pectobacterium brasiliense TaxID=180957 RepID=UPI0030179B53